ncbi:MAG: hypothetical protein CMK92_01925 [Pseudomonas sp.]|nr:hypothetical protein [Pseudomonas sp.]|tara:strand:+ start:590 stop:1534 length:945 start_codon:yes stop_codon:yes gene_type:complete
MPLHNKKTPPPLSATVLSGGIEEASVDDLLKSVGIHDTEDSVPDVPSLFANLPKVEITKPVEPEAPPITFDVPTNEKPQIRSFNVDVSEPTEEEKTDKEEKTDNEAMINAIRAEMTPVNEMVHALHAFNDAVLDEPVIEEDDDDNVSETEEESEEEEEEEDEESASEGYVSSEESEEEEEEGDVSDPLEDPEYIEFACRSPLDKAVYDARVELTDVLRTLRESFGDDGVAEASEVMDIFDRDVSKMTDTVESMAEYFRQYPSRVERDAMDNIIATRAARRGPSVCQQINNVVAAATYAIVGGCAGNWIMQWLSG